jgi:hypothetical protein
VDGLSFGSNQPTTPETVVARVVRDASRAYGDQVDESTLAVMAESVVADLWGESVKVTSFLPVLAMRQLAQQIRVRASETANEPIG